VDKVYAATGRNSVSEPLPCHHRSTSNVLHSRLSLSNNPSQLFKLGNKTVRINLRDTVFKIIKLRSSRLRSFLDTVHAQSDKGNSSYTSNAKPRERSKSTADKTDSRSCKSAYSSSNPADTSKTHNGTLRVLLSTLIRKPKGFSKPLKVKYILGSSKTVQAITHRADSAVCIIKILPGRFKTLSEPAL